MSEQLQSATISCRVVNSEIEVTPPSSFSSMAAEIYRERDWVYDKVLSSSVKILSGIVIEIFRVGFVALLIVSPLPV